MKLFMVINSRYFNFFLVLYNRKNKLIKYNNKIIGFKIYVMRLVIYFILLDIYLRLFYYVICFGIEWMYEIVIV